MVKENYRWLAALVAAHNGRRVVGRTRLQKEIKLLQRIGFPTDYQYMIHFYGPYSDGVSSDIGLLDDAGLVKETPEISQDGNQYYVLNADAAAVLPEIEEYRPQIEMLSKAEPVVLELAATYDAFREAGSGHEEALQRLRRKKGSKCDGGNVEAAISLLNKLELPTD